MSDLREALLLQQAARALAGRCTLGVSYIRSQDVWLVHAPRVAPRQEADTLAEALEALLRDLGEEPVEWPSEEEAHVEFAYIDGPTEDSLYADELVSFANDHGPLALLAVLGLGPE